jgi:hypothetical protein
MLSQAINRYNGYNSINNHLRSNLERYFLLNKEKDDNVRFKRLIEIDNKFRIIQRKLAGRIELEIFLGVTGLKILSIMKIAAKEVLFLKISSERAGHLYAVRVDMSLSHCLVSPAIYT